MIMPTNSQIPNISIAYHQHAPVYAINFPSNVRLLWHIRTETVFQAIQPRIQLEISLTSEFLVNCSYIRWILVRISRYFTKLYLRYSSAFPALVFSEGWDLILSALFSKWQSYRTFSHLVRRKTHPTGPSTIMVQNYKVCIYITTCTDMSSY